MIYTGFDYFSCRAYILARITTGVVVRAKKCESYIYDVDARKTHFNARFISSLCHLEQVVKSFLNIFWSLKVARSIQTFKNLGFGPKTCHS